MISLTQTTRPVRSQQTVEQSRRRISRHGPLALLAMLTPAVLFPLCLWFARHHPRLAWLGDVSFYPWEFWAVAVCGTIASLGGTADWFIHRRGGTTVGTREHRAHLAALAGGGIPLFMLMALASLSSRPESFLVPVFIVVIFMVVLISYDEFVFHRRCGDLETVCHRMLTLGNGLAFLAWVHWCFVRGGGHA